MPKVLTENQELLARYLAAVGCEKLAVILMIVQLWDDEAVIQMLEFCRDNPNASQEELLKKAEELASAIETDEEDA